MIAHIATIFGFAVIGLFASAVLGISLGRMLRRLDELDAEIARRVRRQQALAPWLPRQPDAPRLSRRRRHGH